MKKKLFKQLSLSGLAIATIVVLTGCESSSQTAQNQLNVRDGQPIVGSSEAMENRYQLTNSEREELRQEYFSVMHEI